MNIFSHGKQRAPTLLLLFFAYQRRRKLFSTGGALHIIRTQFLWRKLYSYEGTPKTGGTPAPLALLVPTPMLTSQDLSLMYKSWIHPALEYGNILYAGGDIIYNGLIVYSLKLSGPVAHTFNHYFIIIMHQLLDWFVISMLVRGEELLPTISWCWQYSSPVYPSTWLGSCCTFAHSFQPSLEQSPT